VIIMMNKKFFSIGFLLSIFIFCGISYASNGFEDIEIIQNSVKIFVNNKEITAPNFIFEDKNFIPLRAVSDQLGYNVYWDSVENSADIFTPNYELPITNENFLSIKGKPIEVKIDTSIDKSNPFFEYKYKGIDVSISNGKVAYVNTTDKNWETNRGIKIGDDLSKVIAMYGYCSINPYWNTISYIVPCEEWASLTNSIEFVLDDNKKVSNIVIRLTGF